MTEGDDTTDEVDTNPLVDILPEVDFEFYRLNSGNFGHILRVQNDYNPLIAYQSRKKFPDFDQKHFTKHDTLDLNSHYHSGLHMLREGIQFSRWSWIIGGLENLWKDFQKMEVPFHDFLSFSGIFHGCRWIWREKKFNGHFHDVIYTGNYFEGWQEFIQPGLHPADKLTGAFGDLLNEKTEDFGALGFKNPLAQIIQNKIEENTFSNAEAFIRFKALHDRPDNRPAISEKNSALNEEAAKAFALAERIIKAYKPPVWKRERIGYNAEAIIKSIVTNLPRPRLRLDALLQEREKMLLAVKDKPEGAWIMNQAGEAYNAIKDKLDPEEWYELSKETWDFHRDAVKFDTAIEEQKKLIEYENNFGNAVKVDSKKFTQPITAARLAIALGVSNSTLSNAKRPLGKYFQSCCTQQNTKAPRLNIDVLFPLAQESIRRSRKKYYDESDRDANQLKSIKDLKERLM